MESVLVYQRAFYFMSCIFLRTRVFEQTQDEVNGFVDVRFDVLVGLEVLVEGIVV